MPQFQVSRHAKFSIFLNRKLTSLNIKLFQKYVLVATLQKHHFPSKAVLADKAYDADDRMRQKLLQNKCEVVIPPKKNRLSPVPYDKDLYKARHLIENFFAKLKQYRAIATRYDKTSRNFLGAIYMVASVIWLN